MNINIQQLEGLEISKYIIFDIRDNIAYMHGYIPGALNVKPEDVEEEAKKYRDKKIIICCKMGQISEEVAENLCQ